MGHKEIDVRQVIPAPPAAVFAARDIWHSINRPNLIENILPTRQRARLILRKAADHLSRSASDVDRAGLLRSHRR
jgi:hypothetical protein